MAKDPAFLFYPGDASEDTQILNRLERGAYFDILKAQKKYRKFTLDQIKRLLGNDYETVWPGIQLCLTYEDDLYFISWVDDSITKRKEYSEGRRNNRKGKAADLSNDDIKSEKESITITSLSHENICSTHVEHMENENENENKKEIKEGGVGETIKNDKATTLIVPEMLSVWKEAKPNYIVIPSNEYQPLREIAELLREGLKLPGPITGPNTSNEILIAWKAMVNFVSEDKHFKNYQISQILKYFNSIASQMANGSQGTNKKSLVQSNKEAAEGAMKILMKKYGKSGFAEVIH